MNNAKKAAKICCFICVALMLMLLVLQFVPYWNYGDDSASIAGYVWMPHEHKALTKEFRAEFGSDYEVRQMVLMPVTVLVTSVLGMIFCIRDAGKGRAFLLPMVSGAMAVYGFMAVAVFRLGTSHILQTVVSVVLLVVSILGFVLSLLKRRVRTD